MASLQATKLPTCAIIALSATVRRNVLLPEGEIIKSISFPDKANNL